MNEDLQTCLPTNIYIFLPIAQTCQTPTDAKKIDLHTKPEEDYSQIVRRKTTHPKRTGMTKKRLSYSSATLEKLDNEPMTVEDVECTKDDVDIEDVADQSDFHIYENLRTESPFTPEKIMEKSTILDYPPTPKRPIPPRLIIKRKTDDSTGEETFRTKIRTRDSESIKEVKIGEIAKLLTPKQGMDKTKQDQDPPEITSTETATTRTPPNGSLTKEQTDTNMDDHIDEETLLEEDDPRDDKYDMVDTPRPKDRNNDQLQSRSINRNSKNRPTNRRRPRSQQEMTRKYQDVLKWTNDSATQSSSRAKVRRSPAKEPMVDMIETNQVNTRIKSHERASHHRSPYKNFTVYPRSEKVSTQIHRKISAKYNRKQTPKPHETHLSDGSKRKIELPRNTMKMDIETKRRKLAQDCSRSKRQSIYKRIRMQYPDNTEASVEAHTGFLTPRRDIFILNNHSEQVSTFLNATRFVIMKNWNNLNLTAIPYAHATAVILNGNGRSTNRRTKVLIRGFLNQEKHWDGNVTLTVFNDSGYNVVILKDEILATLYHQIPPQMTRGHTEPKYPLYEFANRQYPSYL